MRQLKIIFQFVDWFFEDSQKKITNRFEFLDGYRGFCALVVALNHFVPAFGGDGGDLAIFIWSGEFFESIYHFWYLCCVSNLVIEMCLEATVIIRCQVLSFSSQQ
ncbi:hypothetical protein BpHYR1_052400 [Brachionus plicatilis]|uniref:Uncharacterized protein n=1 Tax=Brachionus plicatilis TaxID=10195 RepID=A0A3M7P5C9_BRAPC|nr:hypothetical protein BpHYR1_052400 [Brachionus plicatilis]